MFSNPTFFNAAKLFRDKYVDQGHPEVTENYFSGHRPTVGCLGAKYFFSYSKESGVEIIKLNELEILFRDILHVFGSSYLEGTYRKELEKGFDATREPVFNSQNTQTKTFKIYSDILGKIGKEPKRESPELLPYGIIVKDGSLQMNSHAKTLFDMPLSSDSSLSTFPETIPTSKISSSSEDNNGSGITPTRVNFDDRPEFKSWFEQKKPQPSHDHLRTLIELYPYCEDSKQKKMKEAFQKLACQPNVLNEVVKKSESEEETIVFLSLLDSKKDSTLINELWRCEKSLETNEQGELKSKPDEHLAFVLHHMDHEQLVSSMKCKEFWELLKKYTEVFAFGLKFDHVSTMEQFIKNKHHRKYFKNDPSIEQVFTKLSEAWKRWHPDFVKRIENLKKCLKEHNLELVPSHKPIREGNVLTRVFPIKKKLSTKYTNILQNSLKGMNLNLRSLSELKEEKPTTYWLIRKIK